MPMNVSRPIGSSAKKQPSNRGHSSNANQINYPNIQTISSQPSSTDQRFSSADYQQNQQTTSRQMYQTNNYELQERRSTRVSETEPFIYPSAWQTPNQTDGPRIDSTSTLVELSLSCLDLPNADIVTKSDPQIFVYRLDPANKGTQCEIGRTEMIADNLNPKFAKKITMQYQFEQIQYLRFEVIDIDPIGGHDFLGRCDTTLAEIITSRGSTFKQPLKDGPRKRPGYLIVDVEELTACKQIVSFNISASDLPPSFCGLLSPSASVHIYRANENGSYTIVHRAPRIARSCNPKFKTIQQKLLTLCNGDLDRTIKFEIIDERFGMDRLLGFFETTVNSLKRSCRFEPSKQQVYDLMTESTTTIYNKNKKRKISQSKAILTDFKLMTQATFLDYIRAGAEIHFVVAIDFTASNGDPTLMDSLHHIDPQGRFLNPYEASLLAVGNILKPYDTKNMFAGFGFGAKLNGPNKPPSHLFPLNGNSQHPYVSSIDELLHAYRKKLYEICLSGPTNFAPCIQHCDTISRQFDDGNHYFVLLIVTDGIISDMAQTKRAIVEASNSPLSIIICGVGDAEFTAMNELDSDDVTLIADGKAAARDIVQFVPMNQYLPRNQGAIKSPQVLQLLAEEVLREVPDQLTGYMVSHNFHSDLTYTSDVD